MRGTMVSWACLLWFAVGCAGPSEEGGFASNDSSGAPDPVDEDEPIWLGLRLVRDATSEAGLDWSAPEPTSEHGPLRRFAGGGAVAADLDGDSIPDLLLTAVDGPNALFLGLGDGRFEARPDSGLEEGSWTFGGAAADLDGDGLREVFLFDDHELRLFQNLGDGAFAELPPPLVADDDEWVVGAAFVDYDGDEQVDAYVVVQGDWAVGAEPPAGGEDRLLGGLGGLLFEDRSEQLGGGQHRMGQGFAATWLDADGDGELDIYVANDKGSILAPNRLFLQRQGGFVEDSSAFGLNLRIEAMGIAQADLGHDGRLELAITDIDSKLHLMRLGEGGAVEISEAVDARPPLDSELLASWATQLEDFDNDGEADLLTAWGSFDTDSAPGRTTLGLWRGEDFTDVSPGLPALPDPTWRAVLPVDLNQDGQLDWVQTCLVGAPAVMMALGTDAHWLDVQLEGPTGNRDGLGARVRVLAGGIEQERLLGAGISGAHSSQEPVLHFGLGPVDELDEVQVHWPDGSITIIDQPAPDQRLLVSRD